MIRSLVKRGIKRVLHMETRPAEYGGPTTAYAPTPEPPMPPAPVVPEAPQPEPEADPVDPTAAPDTDPTNNEPQSASGTTDSPPTSPPLLGPPSPAPPVATPWKSARIAMTSFSRHGGAERARVAGQRYVRARGGSRAAASTASTGRSATANLGGFLSNVASSGFTEAARNLGLTLLVGQSVTSVLNAILNVLAPPGASNEEAVARRATAEVLTELFERHAVEEQAIERLNSMSANDVAAATEKSVAAYIYQRWLLELGKKIEEGAYSDREAVRMEREVKEYVRHLVTIDLQGRNILTIDWNGVDGQQFCERIFQEAYALLEGA